MKENLKNKKGITLIALVITIIVLLILAIVTIRIVVNQNIINHANNAVTAYNEAQNNESAQLTWVEELMKNKGGSSASNSNSGNSNEVSSAWWIIPEAQEVEYYIIASTDTEGARTGILNVPIGGGNEVPIVMMETIANSEEFYCYFVDERTVSLINNTEGKNKTGSPIELFTWYKGTGEFDINEKYEGTSPIAENSFTHIYNQNAFDHIMQSFH